MKKKELGSINPVDLIAGWKRELKDLEILGDGEFRTGGKATGIDGGDLNKMSSTKEVRALIGQIAIRAQAHELAVKLLGEQEYPIFDQDGFTLEVWATDCQKRMAFLTQADKKKELEGLIEEAKTFITKEELRKDFMEKVEARGFNSSIVLEEAKK